jgi:hypothetical protein
MVGDIIRIYPDHQRYFIIADPAQDEAMYHKAKDLIPSIKLYDRQQYDITRTLTFIRYARYTVAARLHILLVSQYFSTPFTPLIYAAKVRKMIDVIKRPLFVSIPLLRAHRPHVWEEKLLAIRIRHNCRVVYAQGDNNQDFANTNTLHINNHIIATNPASYHQQCFTLLKERGSNCTHCMFVVGGDPERFLPLITYCQSLGILAGLMTLTSDQQTRWHEKFPSIQVFLVE